MIRAYTITSGKGGVGKTTLAVNLGISLAQLNRETYILDADIGMANMALILGMDNVTVRKLVDTPNRAESPAAIGTLGLVLQFAAVAQFSSALLIQVASIPP